MKYLVTGSGGFVGPYLLEALKREAGAVVVGMGRTASTPDTRVVDLLDRETLFEVIEVERPDAIIHLAAISSVAASWEDPARCVSNNTQVFLNLVDAMRAHVPKARLLSVGSAEVYGAVPPDGDPLRETAVLAPANPYGVARVAQEQLGQVYARGFGLHIVATRSFNHIGAGQSAKFVVAAFAKQFAEIKTGKRDHLTVGTTSIIRDFLDVRDVVSAYQVIIARGRSGQVYNVCSGHGISIATVIEKLATISELTPTVVTDPALVRPVDVPVLIGSHNKITDELGWQPQYLLGETLEAVYKDALARL